MTNRRLKALTRLFGALLVACVPFASAAAQEMRTSAAQAILIDAGSGTVLFEKNADEPMVPASMAKVMTVEVIAQEMRAGRIDETTTFRVSENAWRTGGAPSGGSTMFAQIGSEIPLMDLLRGIIIHSGNDASIAAAEGIAGSEDLFAQMMTRRARELGLRNSEFRNATGYHHPEQVSTARDLAILTRHLIREEPEIYAMFGEEEFMWNNIRQRNRNPLLTMNIGADGVKTGYLSEAGYGLIGSAVQNDRRLVLVVNGLETAGERASESRKLLTWGFNNFDTVRLFDPGEVIGEARTFGGERSGVPLVSREPVTMLVPRGPGSRLSARIVYEGPIVPPIAEGQQIGRLVVARGGTDALSVPLYAATPVRAGSIPRRAMDSLWELSSGAFRRLVFGEEG